MKVISGSIRGRKLKSVEGLGTRPTIGRIKEAIFNIIQFDVSDDSVVYDLFAGTGQMGIECLSRGAKRAYFFENDPKAVAVIKANVAIAEMGEEASVEQGDCYALLERFGKDKADLIFLDPPYGGEMLEKALFKIAKVDILHKSGIIICESAVADVFALPPELEIKKQYKYGAVLVSKIVKV